MIGGLALSGISAGDLVAELSGDPEALDVHLQLIERDVQIAGHSVRVHCHCLTLDGNGRVQPKQLAEFLRRIAADYAIPKSKMAAAKARDAKFNTTETVSGLIDQARNSFTDLAKTGEGGEMLLFLLAERFLKLPLILCKMDLKTDSRMHYHGADGVYAGVADDGILKLYWGESKVYQSVTTGIRDCLSSLAPFLIEPEGEGAERERDLVLLSDRADLSDPALTDALRKYFDRSSPMSRRVKYCGIALVGFDAAFYPVNDASAVADQIANEARAGLEEWCVKIGDRLVAENLQKLEIEFLCLPLPSAEGFRTAFLNAMGLTS